MSELVTKARTFATEVHRRIDQRRKYTKQPYEVHLKAVARIVATVSDDPEMIAAAWLHDTVEDTPATTEEIEATFGANVALLVRELTDVSQPGDGNRATRKAIDRAHLANASARAKTIKLADLIDNCQDICREDPKFAEVFCDEMEALLKVLGEGDERLTRRAGKVLAQCRLQIGQPPGAQNDPEELSFIERRNISEHKQALQTFARTFTAGDIAEPLRSFDAVRTAAEVKESMQLNGLAIAGIREQGKVSGFVIERSLGSGLCGDYAVAFRPTHLRNAGASLTEVVTILNIHDCCFITAIGEVVGVIGRGNMHNPIVRMWLFGIISFIEVQYTDHIRSIWPDNEWSARLSESRIEQAKALQKERQRRNQSCDLVDCLQFGDKLRILQTSKDQLKLFGFGSAGSAKRVMKDVESLRNNLAHGQDFVSNDWTQVIRIAQRLEVMLQASGKT